MILMNPALEQLQNEHEAIKTMLRVIEAVCEKLEAKGDVNPDDLDQMADFIKIFADTCHHHKEEKILFPKMAERGIPVEGGPLGVMLYEHNLGRDFVRGMNEGIAKYRNEGDSSHFVGNARGYASLLDGHIDKENDILYPLAENVIAPEEMEALLQEFNRVESEHIGEGKHDEYHALLNRLVETYLGEEGCGCGHEHGEENAHAHHHGEGECCGRCHE